MVERHRREPRQPYRAPGDVRIEQQPVGEGEFSGQAEHFQPAVGFEAGFDVLVRGVVPAAVQHPVEVEAGPPCQRDADVAQRRNHQRAEVDDLPVPDEFAFLAGHPVEGAQPLVFFDQDSGDRDG